MTLLPDLEAQLAAAARRTQPSALPVRAIRAARPRRQLVLIAVAVALLLASVAVAAVQLTAGPPVPRSTGLGSPVGGPGHPLPGSTRLLAVRAADPDGGPAWGIRVYRTNRDAACWQVARVFAGRLGVLGRDGMLADDGLFHELPVEIDQCRPLDGAGQLFASQEALALDNGVTTRLTCLPRQLDARSQPHGEHCPDGSARVVLYGFLGPLARSVTTSDGASAIVSPSDEGAYLFVRPLEDPMRSPPITVSAHYADGTTRRVQDVPPVESVDNPGDDGTRPPGYVDPLRTLPSPARVRTHLDVSSRRLGENRIYTVRFKAPVSVHRYGVEYSVLVDGPAQGRSCERPMRFAGFNTNKDVRAGQPIAIKLTPAIAQRWNRGWCPGEYRVTVVLHDPAHPLGSFTFRAP